MIWIGSDEERLDEEKVVEETHLQAEEDIYRRE